MKLRFFMLPVRSALFGVAVLVAGCAVLGGARKAPPVVGTWDYAMSSPTQGSFSGTMTLVQAEEGYSGHITVQEMGIDEAMAIERFEAEGPAFTFDGSAGGYAFTMTGAVDGDALTGQNDVQGVGTFELSATRVKEE